MRPPVGFKYKEGKVMPIAKRPAPALNDLVNFSPYQLKKIEIENLKKDIDKMQERLALLQSEISYIPNKSENRIWMSTILERVCKYTDFTPADIVSSKRYRELVKARSLYINLCLDLTKHGVTHIARTCGDRDHTTVCYHQKIKAEKSKYWNVSTGEGQQLWLDFDNIKQELLAHAERKK